MENIIPIISVIVAIVAVALAWHSNRIAKRATTLSENANRFAEQSNTIAEKAFENALADRDYKITPQIRIRINPSKKGAERWEFVNVSGSDLFDVECKTISIFCKTQPFSRSRGGPSINSFFVKKQMPKDYVFIPQSDFADFAEQDLEIYLGLEYDPQNSVQYELFCFDCRRSSDLNRFVWSQAFFIYPNKYVKAAPNDLLDKDIPVLQNTHPRPWDKLCFEKLWEIVGFQKRKTNQE